MIVRFLLSVLIILCPPVFAADAPPPFTTTPQDDGSVVIVLSPEMVNHCVENGGCRIMSAAQMMNFLREVKPKLCNKREI